MGKTRESNPHCGPRCRALSAETSAKAANLPSSSPSAPSAVVGQLLAGSTPHRLRVDFHGNQAGPLEARTILQLSATLVEQAVLTSQEVLLMFDAGDVTAPIVIGLIQAPELTPFEALLTRPRESTLALVKSPPKEARVDGERVVLEANREIVLRCGEASITLRRDGKVAIRGAYIETHAKGVNRIKGGAVKIN